MASSKSVRLVWVAAAAAIVVGAWAIYRWTSPNSAQAPAATSGGAAPGPRSDPASPTASAIVPPASAPPTTERIKVQGIVSSGGEGLAIIAVGGAPARTFRVGDRVDGELILRGISSTGITIGLRDGTGTVSLEATPAVAGIPATVAPPTARTGLAPAASLTDGSAHAQENLRKLGSKHPPIAPQIQSQASKAAAAPAQPIDDGRWRPATQP